jgi:hypothetical protein
VAKFIVFRIVLRAETKEEEEEEEDSQIYCLLIT